MKEDLTLLAVALLALVITALWGIFRKPKDLTPKPGVLVAKTPVMFNNRAPPPEPVSPAQQLMALSNALNKGGYGRSSTDLMYSTTCARTY